MAEFEPGHPDELVATLTNWLKEARSSDGSLPENTDPVEWAVRRFIASWKGPVRAAVDSLEANLSAALVACQAGNVKEAIFEIECARQTLSESLRDELGLYDWNRE